MNEIGRLWSKTVNFAAKGIIALTNYEPFLLFNSKFDRFPALGLNERYYTVESRSNQPKSVGMKTENN